MSTTIHFMFNMHPHYHRVTFDRPYGAITVKLILDEAHRAHKLAHALAEEPEAQQENFQLRYITEERAVFSLADVNLSDHDAILAKADGWYEDRGHHLTSTCIGPDDSTLVETVAPAPDSSDGTPAVRLYVIVAADVIPVLPDAESPPLLAKRRIFIEKSQALLTSGEEMSPSEDGESTVPIPRRDRQPYLGTWATIYEPVFAYARAAFEGFLPVRPDIRDVDENFEVIDGDQFDIRICVYDLRSALGSVKYKPDSAHVEALTGLLQGLFDDPALQVNVKQVRHPVEGYLSTDVEIIGECHTAHGLPALYIMGNGKLLPKRWRQDQGEGFDAYTRAVVGPKYAAVREMTCCPCLVIELTMYSVCVYAAYLSDAVSYTQLCDIPLLDPWLCDGVPGEYSDTYKCQVVRKTAQQLRRSYARVHTGAALPGAPHVFPQVKSIVDRPFPYPLTLLDRVLPDATCPSSSAAPPDLFLDRAPLLFTGVIQGEDGACLPGPIHIKFTADRTYGVDAHLLLAKYERDASEDEEEGEDQNEDQDQDMHEDKDMDEDEDMDMDPEADSEEGTSRAWPLAPAFLYRKLFPGARTWMLFLKALDGATLEHLLAAPGPQRGGGAAVSPADLADIRTAVAVLHRHGFVHGDIRPSNVLVQRRPADSDSDSDGGRGRARAYLLDFDWAGRAGEARYPETLDERLEWPRPVSELRGRLITKRDDRIMLRRLFALVREKQGAGGGADGAENVEQEWIDDDVDDDGDDEEEKLGEAAALSTPKSDDERLREDILNSPWSGILTLEKAVDFGQAWKARGAVYPVNINPRIKWPRPAAELRCQPITKEHDRIMFEDMLRMLRAEAEEDADRTDADANLKRKLEEDASGSEEGDGPRKRKPDDDDDDVDEDGRETMMTLG